jgi:putative oxidoreductase
MTLMIWLYNTVFGLLERAAGTWLMPSLARLVFAGTLLMYFWASGATKLGNGVLGVLFLDIGAYARWRRRATTPRASASD